MCVRRADRCMYGRPGRAGVGPRKAEILGGQDHPERAEVRPFFPPPFRTRGVRTHGPLAGMHRAHRVRSSVRSGQATMSGFGARLGAPLACKRYTSRPRSVVAPAYACPLAVRRCFCCIVVLLWALLAIRAPIRPPAVPRYRDAAFIEIDILRKIRERDPHGRSLCIPFSGWCGAAGWPCARACVRACVPFAL